MPFELSEEANNTKRPKIINSNIRSSITLESFTLLESFKESTIIASVDALLMLEISTS